MNREDENNSFIFKRLNRHVHERIKEICEAIEVDKTLVNKMETLLTDIIKHKLELLQNNKLDQIIICSIAACLSLNE